MSGDDTIVNPSLQARKKAEWRGQGILSFAGRVEEQVGGLGIKT